MRTTDNLHTASMHPVARRLTVYTLVALQALPLPTWAATALIADPAAVVKPVLNVSGNGVPIVQIVPPNAGGVSHNKFTQYNVGIEGQILNNSGLGSASALAGSVGGNPLLGNSNARLILNEVTSANPSALNGLIEITGKRADLVIANPNGISVDGAGFINAGRATLATGKPQFGADGGLLNFDIRQGQIGVQGKGLDARGADQLQLLSRSLLVNAKLQANWLDIATGANQINATTGAITPQAGTGTAPTVAVDVSKLGSMYANSIYLVGTEAGVGVNVKGKLEALTGDIQLSSAGDLNIVDGGAKAAWDVRIDAARDIRIQGSDIQAGGDAEIVAGRNLDIVATDNSTSGSSVSGYTTTTTATTKWTGSVVEAGGDVTLVANNRPGAPMTTAELANYETNKAAATVAMVAAQTQIDALKPEWDSAQWYYNFAQNNNLWTTWQTSMPSLVAYVNQTNAAYNAALTKVESEREKQKSLIARHDGGKLTLSASAVRANGNALLAASNVAVESKADSQLVRSVYYQKKQNWLGQVTSVLEIINQSLEETLVGGAVSAAGDNTILALGNRDSAGGLIADTGNLLLLGSAISSDLGAAQLTAVNDLEVEAAQTRHDNSSEVYKRKANILSTTKTTEIDRSQNLIAEGSLVTGDSVQLQSGRDLMVRGGIVSADNDVSLVAGRDIDIVEARDFESRDSIRIKKKSGIFGSGLFGITIGSTSTTQITEEDLDTASASQIASLSGGLSLLGGNNVLIQGADLLAGTDIDIVGNNVGILAARNIYDRRDIYKTKTSGLTLALKGGVISALEAAWQASQRAHGAQDDRLQAAYALKAGYHFYDALSKNGGQAITHLLEGDVLSSVTGVNLELSLGTSSAQSVNTLHDVTYRASNLDAGGDLTVIARDSESQSTGIIDIMGSNLAAYNQTLSGAWQINVRHAPQTAVSTEKSSNRAASIGVGIGTNGLYYTAAGQVGKATGEALKEDNAESRLIADNTLTLLTGGDAIFKGAIAQAHRIEADIAGNLTLASLQDHERYKYKSANAGGSVTVGTSVSASISGGLQTINNQFQSVVEQTGLFAGDGGFNLKVGGHTWLDGAAIASSATPDKNKLTTGTLAYTDLINREQTSTGGITFGLSTAPGGTFVTPVPNQNVNRSSVTQSLVSPGTFEITGLDAPTTAWIKDKQSRIAILKTQLHSLLTPHLPQTAAYTPDQLIAYLDYSTTTLPYSVVDQAWALLDPLYATQSELDTRVDSEALWDYLQPATLQSRTLASANPALANTFNKDKTRAQLEAMSVFAETAMRIVGDVYKARLDTVAKRIKTASDQLKAAAPGSAQATQAQADIKTAEADRTAIENERAPAHGLVGALTAAIGGTSPVSGFIGGAAGKLAVTELEKMLATSTWASTNPIAANLLKTLTATAVGSIVGGSTGGFVASNGDRFNRQLHVKEISLARKYAKALQQKAAANGEIISELEAEARIERQILRWVNAATNTFDGGKVDQVVISTIGISGQDAALGIKWDYRDFATLHAAEYNNANLFIENIGLYSPALYTTNYGRTPAQLEQAANDNKRLALTTGLCLSTGLGCAAISSYNVGKGITQLRDGNTLGGSLEIAGGLLGIGGSIYGPVKAMLQEANALPWKPGYALNPLEANNLVKAALPPNTTANAELVTSLNVSILSRNPNYQPSYLPGTTAYTYAAPSGGQSFVRVYVDGANSQAAPWIARAEDVAGLTPLQIKDKFALSSVPTHITNVNVPAGTQIRASVANGILGTHGGGVQFEILTRPVDPNVFRGWFTNGRSL